MSILDNIDWVQEGEDFIEFAEKNKENVHVLRASSIIEGLLEQIDELAIDNESLRNEIDVREIYG